MLITCLSGLAFNARKWRIEDRRNLQDPRIAKSGLQMQKMLETAAQDVVDAGPYQNFQVGRPPIVSKMCISDIIDALVQIRIAHRPQLDYDEVCLHCKRLMSLSVDLSGLEKHPISADGINHIITGEPYRTSVLIDDENGELMELGIGIRFLRGEDIPIIAQHHRQNPTKSHEVALVRHVTSIRKPDGETLTEFMDIWKFFGKADLSLHEELDNIISDLEGGIDTSIDAECEFCLAEQQHTVPFTVPFFYPRKSKRRSSTVNL